jgi:pimeloyl-ACP methyl ester carboxylesterase
MSFFTLKDGVKIAYQNFGGSRATKAKVRKALCFHGWLDNSSTFSQLGPALGRQGWESTCIDFAGHGHSDHAHVTSNTNFHQMVIHAREVFDQVRAEGEKVTIIGHSMGGSVALLFAATHPELVHKLVLLESFGPMSRKSEDAVSVLRKAIDGKLAFNKHKMGRPPKVYSLETAVQARVNTALTWPGDQTISEEAARLLITRGTEVMADGEVGWEATGIAGAANAAAAGVRIKFRHDQRLYLPSPSYYAPEHVTAFFNAIECPTLLVTGTKGWPTSSSQAAGYKAVLEDKGLLTHVVLDGSHHLHLDPDTAPAVAEAVVAFLDETEQTQHLQMPGQGIADTLPPPAVAQDQAV